MKNTLAKALRKIRFSRGLHWDTVKHYTLLPKPLVVTVLDLLDQAPSGAFVETGCWKGGLGALVASKGYDTWLFDSFEGLPEYSQYDKKLRERGTTFEMAVDERYPYEIAQKLGSKPHIVKGWFKDTIPRHKHQVGKIAVLRLDGDNYQSTLDGLELYDQVVSGGFVIVDDYHAYDGCRHALYQFFVKRGIAPYLHHEYGGRVHFKV